jgi:hypothetical protein
MQFHNVHPGDYHVPTPKLGLQVMPMYKPQVVVPEIAASYPDYHGEANMLRAVKDSDIDKAVDEADYEHAGYILHKEVRMCLRTCLGGKEPSTPLAGLFSGYFARKHQTHITRSDLKHAMTAAFSLVMLSPGPGRPAERPINGALLQACAARGVPLFGVCLGMQALGETFGGEVVAAREIGSPDAVPGPRAVELEGVLVQVDNAVVTDDHRKKGLRHRKYGDVFQDPGELCIIDGGGVLGELFGEHLGTGEDPHIEKLVN